MVIGLTILGFGTSATELLVSVLAALLGGLPRIAGVALLAAYAVYVALMLQLCRNGMPRPLWQAGQAQPQPIRAPSVRHTAITAERGRPVPSGQLPPGCCTPTKAVLRSADQSRPVISDPFGPVRKRSI